MVSYFWYCKAIEPTVFSPIVFKTSANEVLIFNLLVWDWGIVVRRVGRNRLESRKGVNRGKIVAVHIVCTS